MIDYKFIKALKIIHKKLLDTNVTWVITGSLGMALQGVDVRVNDIDIQTTSNGSYEIEKLFSDFVIEPVSFSSSEKIRSHLGKLLIEGIEVEIMGDIQKKINNTKWESPVDIKDYLLCINYENMNIPVLSLEYEQQAYMKLGRIEKAKKLRDWLSQSEANYR